MIFLAIFSGVEFKLGKAGPTFSRFNQWTSLPSVATDDRKQFLYLNIDFNIKTGPLFLEFNWCKKNYIYIYVVVNFFISDNFRFSFLFGYGNVANEVETKKKKKKITWDKKITTTYMERFSYDLEKWLQEVFVICFISQWMKRSTHGLFVFPPKKTLIWRRYCSKRSIGWFPESSQAWHFFTWAFAWP